METKIINGLKISFRNDYEMNVVYEDVFIKELYRFESRLEDPIILDCGGHIGLSVLYFKKLYPKSKITVFEPNPETIKLLRLNLEQNSVLDVEVIQAGVSDQKGEFDLFVGKDQSAWDSTNTFAEKLWENMDRYTSVKAKTILLSDYISGRVEMIKMDIEGLEAKVLNEIKPKLNQVRNLTFEYHFSPNVKSQNSFDDIASILEASGFEFNRPNMDFDIEFQEVIKAKRV